MVSRGDTFINSDLLSPLLKALWSIFLQNFLTPTCNLKNINVYLKFLTKFLKIMLPENSFRRGYFICQAIQLPRHCVGYYRVAVCQSCRKEYCNQLVISEMNIHEGSGSMHAMC